jgi:glycosyltransferase involved in cell wall biosynthesis
MSSVLVTIGSASYNAGLFLLDMVRSILAQTVKDWELILLDDGSTDNSFEAVCKVNDPRIKVFVNEKNIGRAASLNKITRLARGRYIARMDADDFSATNRIQRQLELLESNRALDVVGTGIVYLDRNDVPVGHWLAPVEHFEICKEPDRNIRLCHGSIMGKKEWFEKNPYNESLSQAEDFELFFRTYQSSRFSNVPESLYYYRLEQFFSFRKGIAARYDSSKFLSAYYISKGQPLKAAKCVGTQILKFCAASVICLLLSKCTLLQRRYTQISEKERASYMQEIERIKQFEIPLR